MTSNVEVNSFFFSRCVCGYDVLKMKTYSVAVFLTSWLVLFGWFLGQNEMYPYFWCCTKSCKQLDLCCLILVD